MGVFGGPEIPNDGLVLALDAGNRKTFANSLINSTSWSLGSGSATGYGQNGATAENERVTGTDPFGKSATVWETRPQGNNADDGGWNSGSVAIDSTKLYRFSVWVKRTTDSTGGTFYFGTSSNVRRTDNNEYAGNPYWDCRGPGSFTKDVWYLVVGHCYPYNTTYTGQHPETGIYTVAEGTTKVASINSCTIGPDLKWAGSNESATVHRCYHFYCPDNTTRLQFFDPRIDTIDGTEPSIRNLLSGFTASRLSDLIGTNNGTFVNSPTYSSANGGSIVFDGTDDYVDLGSDKVFKTTGGWTVESWVNYDVIPTTYNNTTSPANFIGSETDNTHNSWYWSVLESKLSLWNISPGVWKHGSTILQAYTWYNAVLVCYNSGTSYQMYLNGIAEGGDHTAYSWNASYSGLTIRYIGRGNSGNVRLVDGKIPITKVYDRALTAQEIQQNFIATRSRFSI